MNYSEDLLKKLITVGALGYSVDKIINVLDIEDPEAFKKDFSNQTSEVYKAYKKGMDKSDFSIDVKLFEKAKTGDAQSIDLFIRRKTLNQLK